MKERLAKVTVESSNFIATLEYQAIPDVTLETFVGTLGGILDLWIGISFITIIEFIDLCISMVLRIYKGKQNNVMKISSS